MNTDTATTVDERLARASNTSDLTVTPDRQGDGFMLIAAAKTPRVVGRHLIALHGEWDGCAKPRRMMEHDITALRKTLPAGAPPLVLAPKHLDTWADNELKRRQRQAEVIANGWYEQERMTSVARLKSLERVKVGLLDVLGAKIENPEPKVLGVLAWWLDAVCPKCGGTGQLAVAGNGRQASRPCPSRHRGGCDATGQRPLPHGHDGRIIESAILECISRARQHIGAYRKALHENMR